MITKKIFIVLLIFIISFIASCGPDEELLKKIEDTKKMAMDAKVQTESIKGHVSNSDLFKEGNSLFDSATEAFNNEDYEIALSKYEGAYTFYTTCYTNAEKLMNKAKEAIDKAHIAIKATEEKTAIAEAASQDTVIVVENEAVSADTGAEITDTIVIEE